MLTLAMESGEIRSKILSGNLRHVMVRLSIPSIIGFFFYGLNNLLDGVFVGMYLGKEAFTGLTLAYPIVQMLSGLGLLVGMGAANVLSLAIGREDKALIQKLFGNTVVLTVIIGLGVTVAGVLLSFSFIRAMGGSGEIVNYGGGYLRVIFLGSVFNLVSVGLNLLARGEGNMMVAMKLFALATILNSILTPVFINGLDMGVEGAAWATNISFLFSCAIHWTYYAKFRNSSYQLFRLKLDKHIAQDIIKLGFPSTLLNILILVQYYFILHQIAQIGTGDDIAFFGALNRILMFSILPIYGMSRALQPVVGIAHGSKDLRLSRKAFWLFNNVGTFIMTVIIGLVMIFAENILKIMIPDMILSNRHYLLFYILMASMILMPAMVFTMTFMQAVSKAGLAGILVIFRQVGLFIPLVYLLTYLYGLKGLYSSYFVVDFILFFIGIYFVYHLTKQKEDFHQYKF